MKLVIKAIVAVIFGGIFYVILSLVLGAFFDDKILAQGIAIFAGIGAGLLALFSDNSGGGDGGSGMGGGPHHDSGVNNSGFGGGDFGGGGDSAGGSF